MQSRASVCFDRPSHTELWITLLFSSILSSGLLWPTPLSASRSHLICRKRLISTQQCPKKWLYQIYLYSEEIYYTIYYIIVQYNISIHYVSACNVQCTYLSYAARATFTKMGFCRLFPADESTRSPMRSTQEGALILTPLRPSCSIAEGIQSQCMNSGISHRSLVCSWWTSTHWPSTGQGPTALGMHSLAAKPQSVSNQKADYRGRALQQLKSSNRWNWNHQSSLRHMVTSIDIFRRKFLQVPTHEPMVTMNLSVFWS